MTVDAERTPRVLFIYYSFSEQTRRTVEAMVDAARARGWDATTAEIEFTDPRYASRFSKVPMHRPLLEIVGMLPAQLRRRTGEIRIPPEAETGDHDLVVFGSPTWWLTTNMPIRSYLQSPGAGATLAGKPFAAASVSRRYYKGNLKTIRALGEECGGTWVDATHFVVAGNQVTSMLAWLAYMKHGEARERVLGIKMPPPNLKPDFELQAQHFINGVVDRTSRERAAAAA